MSSGDRPPDGRRSAQRHALTHTDHGWSRCTARSSPTSPALAPIQAHFGRVYLVGDYNIDYFADARHHVSGFPYRQFTHIGYHSMWAGHRPNGGTYGHAVIDGVWARQRPIRRQVLANFRYSDHNPVVATYWLP